MRTAGRNTLDSGYFLRLLNFIGRRVNRQLSVDRLASVTERRKAKHDSQLYSSFVKNEVIKADKLSEATAGQVLSLIDVSSE